MSQTAALSYMLIELQLPWNDCEMHKMQEGATNVAPQRRSYVKT